MQKGLFTGRFQPYGLHHLARLGELKYSHPDTQIFLGVANWQGELTRSNFLQGDEAAEVARLTLLEHNLHPDIIQVPVGADNPLADALQRIHETYGVSTLFSGSPKTIQAAELTELFRIVRLPDDDVSGPRARHIRDSLIEGTDHWKENVAPSAVDYLESLRIGERIRSLPDGEKRPWSITQEGKTASTTSRDRR